MAYWSAGQKLTSARLNAAPGRYPVGGQYRITASSSIATRAAVATSDVLALDPNSLYLVTYYVRVGSVAGTGTVSVTVDIRTNTTGGTVLSAGAATASNSGTATIPPYVVEAPYLTTTAESTAFVGTLAVTASGGGAGAIANIGSFVLVEKLVTLNGVIQTV